MKTKSLIVLFMLALASFIFVGCEQKQLNENETLATESVMKTLNTDTNDNRQEVLITNVVRVFMHEPDQYSVMSIGKDRKLVTHDLRRYGGNGADVRIFTDINPGDPMWVCYKDPIWNEPKIIEIHVHIPEEINGAGWTHRRGRSTVTGTTVEIK